MFWFIVLLHAWVVYAIAFNEVRDYLKMKRLNKIIKQCELDELKFITEKMRSID